MTQYLQWPGPYNLPSRACLAAHKADVTAMANNQFDIASATQNNGTGGKKLMA